MKWFETELWYLWELVCFQFSLTLRMWPFEIQTENLKYIWGHLFLNSNFCFFNLAHLLKYLLSFSIPAKSLHEICHHPVVSVTGLTLLRFSFLLRTLVSLQFLQKDFIYTFIYNFYIICIYTLENISME